MSDPIANDYSFIRARMKEIKPDLEPMKEEQKAPEQKKEPNSSTYYGLTDEEWKEYAIQAAGFQ